MRLIFYCDITIKQYFFIVLHGPYSQNWLSLNCAAIDVSMCKTFFITSGYHYMTHVMQVMFISLNMWYSCLLLCKQFGMRNCCYIDSLSSSNVLQSAQGQICLRCMNRDIVAGLRSRLLNRLSYCIHQVYCKKVFDSRR